MPHSSTRPEQATAPDSYQRRNAGTARFRLSLLGAWELTGADGRLVQSVLAQPQRLGLLAYLALAGKPVARATVVALFWPEDDESNARNNLSQAIHLLRRSLGKNVVENVEGDRIVVRPDYLSFDARELLHADPESAEARDLAETFGDDFFEGWNADRSQPLQEWLDTARREVRAAVFAVRAGLDAEDNGDGDGNGGGDADGDVDGDVDASAHADSVGSAPSGRAGGRRRRPVAAATVLAVLTVLVLVGVWIAGADPPSDRPAAEPAADLVAILMPRVITSGGETLVSAEAIHAEILHMLSESGAHVGGFLSVHFADSPADLAALLEAQSDEPIPYRVVDVLIRVTESTVTMNASLLAGPSYIVVLETGRADYEVDESADGLVRIPQQIADDVIRSLFPD